MMSRQVGKAPDRRPMVGRWASAALARAGPSRGAVVRKDRNSAMVGLSKLHQRVWRLAMSLVLGLSSVLALQAAPVSAAGGEICTGFAVTIGARTYRNKIDIVIPASQVTGTIKVRGVYVTFDVNPTN